jgi:hypothetical protein
MRKLISSLLVLSFFIFCSCATIISGSRQTVRFTSNPSAATVFINEVKIGKTPVFKSLKRNQEYDVVIKLDGYLPYHTSLVKQFDEWFLGNIILCGLIGLIIDPITGAIYKLSPEQIYAPLKMEPHFLLKEKIFT